MNARTGCLTLLAEVVFFGAFVVFVALPSARRDA